MVGFWDPFQVAIPWLINGGDPDHLLSGMILQVGKWTLRLESPRPLHFTLVVTITGKGGNPRSTYKKALDFLLFTWFEKNQNIFRFTQIQGNQRNNQPSILDLNMTSRFFSKRTTSKHQVRGSSHPIWKTYARQIGPFVDFFKGSKDDKFFQTTTCCTLRQTNLAMERQQFWWYLPEKMVIFHGYMIVY